ncbi:type 1 fimbrial protein [Pseudomonas khavaziana]|uniref:type 1 fimbrial protein n=1 Tax=Pseudomonas khavaziana TaxID=2842351 RepID=UPI001C3D750A|nr:type 1 fimbrial protein [Pseudomonas khavaziana]MBV4481753.1 type 1 fimbrial protein [Pseudomonas khavaziana]
MNVGRFSVMASLLCLWASTCGAAEIAGQGTLRFTGAIVESGCATNARSGSVMELRGCARVSRGSRFEARNVASVASVNAAHVRLVADSGEGRYYDQRYLLVDNAGKAIESGNYVITMTSP